METKRFFSISIRYNVSTDLIIYKILKIFGHIMLEQQLQEAYDVLTDKGFLLSVFRYQFTEPELQLNQMNGKKNLKNSDLEKRITDYIIGSKKCWL